MGCAKTDFLTGFLTWAHGFASGTRIAHEINQLKESKSNGWNTMDKLLVPKWNDINTRLLSHVSLFKSSQHPSCKGGAGRVIDFTQSYLCMKAVSCTHPHTLVKFVTLSSALQMSYHTLNFHLTIQKLIFYDISFPLFHLNDQDIWAYSHSPNRLNSLIQMLVPLAPFHKRGLHLLGLAQSSPCNIRSPVLTWSAFHHSSDWYSYQSVWSSRPLYKTSGLATSWYKGTRTVGSYRWSSDHSPTVTAMAGPWPFDPVWATVSPDRYKAVIAHGYIMGFAFAILFPFGAILIRTASFRNLVASHFSDQFLPVQAYCSSCEVILQSDSHVPILELPQYILFSIFSVAVAGDADS